MLVFFFFAEFYVPHESLLVSLPILAFLIALTSFADAFKFKDVDAGKIDAQLDHRNFQEKTKKRKLNEWWI